LKKGLILSLKILKLEKVVKLETSFNCFKEIKLETLSLNLKIIKLETSFNCFEEIKPKSLSVSLKIIKLEEILNMNKKL